MKLKFFVWGMAFLAFVSFLGWIYVIFEINPEGSFFPAKPVFFLLIFIFLTGLFNLILAFLREKISGSGKIEKVLGRNFRQGLLLALLATSLVYFQSAEMLFWWSALLAVAATLIIELYFLLR